MTFPTFCLCEHFEKSASPANWQVVHCTSGRSYLCEDDIARSRAWACKAEDAFRDVDTADTEIAVKPLVLHAQQEQKKAPRTSRVADGYVCEQI